jgi:formylglycine-generating enzyme required for sulfatase activity
MRNALASVSMLIGVTAMTVTGVLVTGSASVTAQVFDLGWVRVPSGTFRMGCVESDPSCLDNERPSHDVTFLHPFELMAAEATVAQYARFVADTRYAALPSPEFPQAGDHPVVLLNWDAAVAFCAWGSGRLPTEAEWEYAARGGQDGLVFGTSQELARDRANYGADQCCSGATGDGDAWENTAPVRSFAPNDFGLYDMTGNVWEWVDGWLDNDYYASSPRVDPPGAASGFARIARGGSWLNFAAALRASVRLPFAQTGQTSNVGVRCARSLPGARAD